MYLIEFLHEGVLQTAFVYEEHVGKLRILLPNRRELSLQENRVLPWTGPQIKDVSSKDEMIKILISHIEKRVKIAEEINTSDLWEMTQGEMEKSNITWFTELLFTDGDIDTKAGVARALFNDKVHFKFSPPYFEIFPADLVETRKKADEAQKKRDVFIHAGMEWLKTLWNARLENKDLDLVECPLDQDMQEHLKKLLLLRIADLDFTHKEDEILWRSIIKVIPDDAFAPFLLATTWKIIPLHYNYWVDKAQYDTKENWYAAYQKEVTRLIESAKQDTSLLVETPFISIDSETTKDIDDAFYLEKIDTGWKVTFALACPAAFWNFDSPFNKVIRERGTSLYLPEATYHMLPEELGTGSYSLFEGDIRPALLIECTLNADAEVISCVPSYARVKVKRNLSYKYVDALLESDNSEDILAPLLKEGYKLSEKLLAKRITQHAVIFERADPQFKVEWKENLPDYYEDVEVVLSHFEQSTKSQLLISEFMVLANSSIADWAIQKNIPFLFRTQDVILPKDSSGIWSKPEDIARIARSLAAATLELQARPHAGMGLTAYATITSPLRRYADLINEAQVLSYVKNGEALFDTDALRNQLVVLNSSLESVIQVQRMRPRYWKLLYCKQQSRKALDEGDDYIWNGVVTEENDHFVAISLPDVQLFLRAKLQFFSDKVEVGQKVKLRLGKINPLKNEIQIIGVEEL